MNVLNKYCTQFKYENIKNKNKNKNKAVLNNLL